MEPLISVIIPAYNAATTIATTIESVLAQTEPNFEIVVVDDGSIDRTAAIVAGLADRRLHLISIDNGGQARARNRGIAAARGEFLAFLDADDRWTADKLAAQLAALRDRPAAAVAYSWTAYVDSEGRSLHRGSEVAVSGWVGPALIVSNFLENGSNPLVRRSAIEAVGGFEPALVPSEDWDLWLRLADRFEFVAVPAVQILYRVSPESQSADTRRLERSCRACVAAWLARQAGLTEPHQAAILARRGLANVYKYLCYKELAGARHDHQPARRFGRGCYLAFQACRYDPRLLRRRVILRLVLRLVAIAVLPWVMTGETLRRWLDRPGLAIEPLLGYIDRPD